MTKDEFWHEYKRLNEKYQSAYPITKDNSTMVLLFDLVKGMDKRWFARIVARVILQNKPDFDFRAAVIGEMRFANDIKRTSDMLIRDDSQMTDNYLEKLLAKRGVNSLVEAIQKQNKED